jgi:hypothetical protein
VSPRSSSTSLAPEFVGAHRAAASTRAAALSSRCPSRMPQQELV